MKYGSVCSGIEAATAAWHYLGWEPVFFSEIESFPCAVLAHHYPDVPNCGDMTKFKEWPDAVIDVLVGGTPCQSFSVAGLRKGLDDPRGNLMLTYLAIADRYRPRWLVWENVPGVLSSNGGRDFGTFLGGLGQLGYGFAYRVLDAQYFGVPQRRRRVFVVGHLGDWRRAAAVLFERHSLQGHPAPRRKAGEKVAGTFGSRATSGGGFNTDFECDGGLVGFANAGHFGSMKEVSVADTLRVKGGDTGNGGETVVCIPVGLGEDGQTARSLTACATASGRMDPTEDTFICHTLRGEGFDASEDGTGRGIPLVPATAYRTSGNCGAWDTGDRVDALTTGTDPNSHILAFVQNTRDEVRLMGGDGQIAGALAAEPGMKQQCYVAQAIAWSEELTAHVDLGATLQRGGQGGRHDGVMTPSMQVRRLTPRECERLQGFPDNYTLIPHRGKPAADGPRYKALGNSMAVPCMEWIGRRIQEVENQ